MRLDPPPLPKMVLLQCCGWGGGCSSFGGVFGLLANQKEDEFKSLAAQGQQGPVEGSRLKAIGDDADRNATIANASFITAGVLAVAAGVMFLFTDWEGYGDEANATTALRTVSPTCRVGRVLSTFQ